MWPCSRTIPQTGTWQWSLPARMRAPENLAMDAKNVQTCAAGASVLWLVGCRAQSGTRIRQMCQGQLPLAEATQDSAGDGRGCRLIAARDLCTGTEVFVEDSVLSVSSDTGMDEVAQKLQDLGPREQESLLGLCHSSALLPKELASLEAISGGSHQLFSLLRVFLINSIGTPGGGSALYLQASRANHSCQPNATFQIGKEGRLRLVTLKPIHRDEEILVSYLPEGALLRPFCKTGSGFQNRLRQFTERVLRHVNQTHSNSCCSLFACQDT